jgi:hypothetical protein
MLHYYYIAVRSHQAVFVRPVLRYPQRGGAEGGTHRPCAKCIDRTGATQSGGYAPECVEVKFVELRVDGVLRSSSRRSRKCLFRNGHLADPRMAIRQMRRRRAPPYTSVEAGATLSLLPPVPRPAPIAGRANPSQHIRRGLRPVPSLFVGPPDRGMRRTEEDR